MFVKIRINIWSYQLLFVSLRTNFKVMYKNYSEKQEKLARFAKALGHPARIAVMQFLAKQEQCYFGDIHEELPIAKATVSQHLSELKDAGLIQGTIEIPKVKYCINQENWQLAQELFKEFFGTTICKGKGCCEK
ncbi:MAG: winged helix-turn-helix transcriptional regulator [Prevotella sp.]|nr:winged helix-turn-helix transcriptional regulator [Prevotella sp.]